MGLLANRVTGGGGQVLRGGGVGTNGTGEQGWEKVLGLFPLTAIWGGKGTAGAGEEAGKP